MNCKNGISALTNTQNAVEKAWSRFYKTEPVDYKNQDWFINVVVKVE
ncbi:MAG: 2-amino-4-hydroxy-6-hydroxymethyldihydropteridine diphosphokinase, partial [Deltaproteobacteria bacterium]|nr:2-amino-4-hydroxy-6-hydroxymethyldihydropteridine diphosphokinase [Deltaproteobacteria bacterium]